jgi:threonine aldolase
MRQAGVLAAAGRHALDHHCERLADDHRRARMLAERIAAVAPATVDPAATSTNLVLVDVAAAGHDPSKFVAATGERGVLLNEVGSRSVRLVTHLDVDDEGAAYAADVLCDLLAR